MNKLVKFQDIVGNLSDRYRIKYLHYSDLVQLGKYAVQAAGKQDDGTRLSFDELCVIITAYISTPFGFKVLKSLANKSIK